MRICSDIRNGLALCFTCHRKSHDDYAFMNTIVERCAPWFKDYEKALRELSRPSLNKIDWDERIVFLKDILKQLEAGELTIEEARSYEL
jgi:hypothetical protein